MERLTYKGNFCDIAMCDPGESGCPKGGCSSKKVWEKLKAYEDAEAGIVYCKDCTWYTPVESNPTAQKIHDILDTGNETGVCRKLTFSLDRPVLTRPDGFCHRAERKDDTDDD